MKRKKWVSIGIGIVIVSLTIAVAAANSPAFSTPLYTVRMEQASNKMHFLPTEMNDFTYNTEKGYNLDVEATGAPDDGIDYTWQSPWTCVFSTCLYTCQTCDGPTCSSTCPDTCSTCSTCPWTCPDTCSTCSTCSTCPDTCSSTCPDTCSTCSTCGYSCGGSCDTCITKPCK